MSIIGKHTVVFGCFLS